LLRDEAYRCGDLGDADAPSPGPGDPDLDRRHLRSRAATCDPGRRRLARYPPGARGSGACRRPPTGRTAGSRDFHALRLGRPRRRRTGVGPFRLPASRGRSCDGRATRARAGGVAGRGRARGEEWREAAVTGGPGRARCVTFAEPHDGEPPVALCFGVISISTTRREGAYALRIAGLSLRAR